jgi:hypothetical protein
MSYSTAEGRQQVLDAVADAIDALASALAALGVAYEQVDEQTGERLEEALFGPVQRAYGRAKRTYAAFAGRVGMAVRELGAGSAGPGARAGTSGARTLIERAASEVARADALLAELQDTKLPVEVGDQELRAGLSEVREILGSVARSTSALVRTLGR